MCRALRSAVAAGLALFVCGEARAQASGFEAGLRTGYGLPLGTAVEGAAADLDELIAGVIPLWIDAGYRLNQNFFLGAYFQYGFGVRGDLNEDACDVEGVDCSVSSHRLGAQLHYHFTPTGAAEPWLGFGFGYEWLSFQVEGQGGEFSMSPSGFELANFQGGLDFFPADHFYLGPFASFSLDQYDSVDIECSGNASAACSALEPVSGDIEDKTIHNWLLIGIRGGFSGVGRN
jgi:hypothetical protein